MFIQTKFDFNYGKSNYRKGNYGKCNLWQVLLMASVTYGKRNYSKNIMANKTEPTFSVKFTI